MRRQALCIILTVASLLAAAPAGYAEEQRGGEMAADPQGWIEDTALWQEQSDQTPTDGGTDYDYFTDVGSGTCSAGSSAEIREDQASEGNHIDIGSPLVEPDRLWPETVEDRSVENIFTDVGSGAYYYEAVLWAIGNEITNGTTAVTFSPDRTCSVSHIRTFLYRVFYPGQGTAAEVLEWACTAGLIDRASYAGSGPCSRSEAMRYLWILSGSPDVGVSTGFEDVPEDHPCAGAIAWAVSQGITNGTTETSFSPDRTCTRGQIMTFLYRSWRSSQGSQD